MEGPGRVLYLSGEVQEGLTRLPSPSGPTPEMQGPACPTPGRIMEPRGRVLGRGITQHWAPRAGHKGGLSPP